MSVITKTAEAVQPGRLARVRNRVAGAVATAVGAVMVPAAAFAEPAGPADQVGDLVTSQFGELTTLLTTVLIVGLFGIVLIGVVVGIGIKYIKRGARQA